MADYSAQSTSLQAPQGSGAEVIAPVQQKSVDDSFLASPAFGAIADIFAKGITNNAKAEALARQRAVVSGYVNEETTINSAVATGQLNAASAAARSRSNFNKYAAGNPEYIEELQKAGSALRGFTEKGQVEDEIAAQKKIRDADISQAQNHGFTFTPDMTKAQQDAQIKAAKTAIQSTEEFDRMVKQNTELRAQGAEGRTLADRNAKDTSIRVINTIAGDNMDAFGAMGQSLAASVKAGTIDPKDAQAQLAGQFGRIQAGLQAAASINPELAAPYRSLFNEANELYKQMLDPKSITAQLEDQLKNVQTKLKLVALQDPKFASYVTVSNLLGNNPALQIGASAPAIAAVARLSQLSPTNTNATYAPQVVGNPDIESDVLKVLKGAVNTMADPKTKNRDAMGNELGNNINQVLKQTGDYLDRGASPQTLKGVAEFFASPEYAKVVTSGTIDKQAAQAAKKTFQLSYEPAIINGVQDKMNGYLYQSSSGPTDKGAEPKTIGSTVDVKFTGSGVVFVPKNEPTNPGERASQQDAVRQLNSSQKAINQLIHIGAHMEGSTDYSAYWEANKHVFMPQVFSKYKNLEIGTVKVFDGKKLKFKGGDNVKENWEEIK